MIPKIPKQQIITYLTTNHPNQLTNQPTNQSNQPANQPTKQPTKPTNQHLPIMQLHEL
jgi:hypothetical protein